jgi:MYND finger
MNDFADIPELALFIAHYWLQKAAVQRHKRAQVRMIELAMKIKELLFDGELNVIGYSCQPELLFWNRMAQGFDAQPPYQLDGCLQLCSCCGREATANCRIHRCVQCHAVGYCRKECQRMHWKMGHKADCLRVDALKTEMERIKSSYGK